MVEGYLENLLSLVSRRERDLQRELESLVAIRTEIVRLLHDAPHKRAMEAAELRRAEAEAATAVASAERLHAEAQAIRRDSISPLAGMGSSVEAANKVLDEALGKYAEKVIGQPENLTVAGELLSIPPTWFLREDSFQGERRQVFVNLANVNFVNAMPGAAVIHFKDGTESISVHSDELERLRKLLTLLATDEVHLEQRSGDPLDKSHQDAT